MITCTICLGNISKIPFSALLIRYFTCELDSDILHNLDTFKSIVTDLKTTQFKSSFGRTVVER